MGYKSCQWIRDKKMVRLAFANLTIFVRKIMLC